jgi:type II secretory pathway pseudopilin PulG
MPSTRRWKHKFGFTLAEIILAMGILVIAILSVAAISFSALASNQKSSDTQTGTLLARQVLEIQSQQALANPTGPVWAQNSITTAYVTDTQTVGRTPFDIRVFVSDIDVPADGDAPLSVPYKLKRMEVVVNWWDSQNTQRKGYGKLETRIARLLHGN